MYLKIIAAKGSNSAKSIRAAGQYTQDEHLHDHRLVCSNLLTPLMAVSEGRSVLLAEERTSLYEEFEAIAALRPDVARPFFHLALSVHPDDLSVATDANWTDWSQRLIGGLIEAENEVRARQRASRGQPAEASLDPTTIAYCAWAHDEKSHGHIHLIGSRVTLDGRLWYGSFLGEASRPICQALEEEYGLVRSDRGSEGGKGRGRELVVRDVAPAAVQARAIVEETLGEAPSYSWFTDTLRERGIVVSRTKQGWRASHAGVDVGPSSRLGLVGRHRPDRLAATFAERQSPRAQLANRLHHLRRQAASYTDWEQRLVQEGITLVASSAGPLEFAANDQRFSPAAVGFHGGNTPDRLREQWVSIRSTTRRQRIVPPQVDTLDSLADQIAAAQDRNAQERSMDKHTRSVGEELAKALSTLGWQEKQVQGWFDQRQPGTRIDLDRQVVTTTGGEQSFAQVGVRVQGRPAEGQRVQVRKHGTSWAIEAVGNRGGKVGEKPKSRPR